MAFSPEWVLGGFWDFLIPKMTWNILYEGKESCLENRVNVIVVIFHVCESSCMSKRQGIYSVIVCRLLSLLLCMALVTSGVLVTSASNCSMRTLTEQVGKCWKMVVKCLVMDISTHYKRVLVEKPGQCFLVPCFRGLSKWVHHHRSISHRSHRCHHGQKL